MLDQTSMEMPVRLTSGPLVFNNELPFRAFLERLPAGAYTCDSEGLITYFNQQAVQLWGRSPRLNDPVDRFCGSFKLFAMDGSPLRHSDCWMALALQNTREYNGHEIMIERPDGQRLTALAHASPIHNEAGVLIGAVNVLVDISERKQAELVLKEADRAKNEFLATLAHELRNPLAPIRAAVKILQLQSKPNQASQSALEVIERQTRQMTRLIDDLLDIARITSNKLELRRERIELRAVLDAAVETSQPLIEQLGHKLVVKAPAAPIQIDGDMVRLAQVISNLLNNAAKYTQRGGRIWLTATRKERDVVIKVRDNGIGIPAKLLPRIFEMFTQVDRAANGPAGGLGIGLTLVKRLVEMHGGTINAQSHGHGKGSEFVLRVPAAAADRPALEVKALGIPERKAAGKEPIRILVVDDNEDSADSMGLLMKLLGNEVRIVHDRTAHAQWLRNGQSDQTTTVG
jgi:PAS domain S-box-containing protein